MERNADIYANDPHLALDNDSTAHAFSAEHAQEIIEASIAAPGGLITVCWAAEGDVEGWQLVKQDDQYFGPDENLVTVWVDA